MSLVYIIHILLYTYEHIAFAAASAVGSTPAKSVYSVSAVRRRRPPPDFRRTCGEKKRWSRELRACIRFTGSIELYAKRTHTYNMNHSVGCRRRALHLYMCNMHSAPSPYIYIYIHTPQYNIFYLHAYIHRVIIIYYVHNV